MKKPLVSIITPSYNQAEFICNAILSIIHQSYDNIEHIVIDGGSTDETLVILRKYEHLYNMRWISESDDGMYDAINKGLQVANGEILAYLNCDDIYLPWAVGIAVNQLYHHPIIYGDAINVDSKNNTTTFKFSPKFIYGYYSSSSDIVQPTVFFRKDVYNFIGTFRSDRFKLLGDCDYWLRCANAGFIPKKIDEFFAIECNHNKTLRERKADILKKEYHMLKEEFSNINIVEYLFYAAFKRIYPRAMILNYMLTRNKWRELKSSNLINITWRRCFAEFIPLKYRLALSFQPFIDIERLFNNV